ncbi:MAG: CoA transferase [Gammaproteobacteria bacterium]|nr:CoA transferase [Gammaproteobacteria bacterium]
METQRALSGIRVIDFAHYLAGPMVGMILADLGAEVIRVDPPGGPRFADASFDMLSRGKRHVTLDLKDERERERTVDLIRRADVLIENFRPGVMDRLGLGPGDLCALNDQLVYVSLPGFASTDDELRGIAAWEAVIAARTGQFTDMGLNRRLMGVNPSFTPLTLASAYAASFGAMSALFALGVRGRCGGDHIEVPLASALFEGLVYNCERVEDYPERYKSPRELELDQRAAEGLPMNLSFDELSEFLDPFYRTYTCADGRGFYVVAGSVASHPRRVLRTLGLDGLLETLPDFSAYLNTEDWPDEWSLRNYPVGARDRERIAAAMKRAFLERPAHEWEALFGAAKAPATAQRSTAEWLHDEHALASGLILRVEDPYRGTMHQVGNVAWLASDGERATEKAACAPADLDSILAEPPRTGRSDDGGPWLGGLKVLDLTNVIAGPTIGSTLARFGARVTHVQPVEPTVDPWNTIVFGLQAQRGKESVLIDLSRDEGRAILERLIDETDVITMNGTDEQRDGLGLSPERMKLRWPSKILVQLDAFGGPLRGPKSDHLGYDDVAQAATGVMLRFGGGMETPEEHAHFGTIDVLTGFCACIALGAALLRRQRSGGGDIARASLAAAGNIIQAQFMYDYPGRPPFDEPSGRAVKGTEPFYHCYEASDGWMFFAAPTDRHEALARVEDLADLADCHEDELHDRLATRFRQRPVSDWALLLNNGSSAIMPLGSLHRTRDDSLQLESDGDVDIKRATYRAIRHDRHAMGRWVDLVAPNAVRPAKGTIVIPDPAPKYGEHTERVLKRLGFDDDAVQRLSALGVVAGRWSERYLPE